MIKKTGTTFMIIGVLLMAASMAIYCYFDMEDAKADAESESIMNQIMADEPIKADLPSQIPTQPNRDMKIKMIGNYGYVGYLTIPALDLKLPVMSEWDYTRLTIAPCLYYGWAGTHDMVIAAHNYRSHFGHLSQLTKGDEITFTDMNKNVYQYEVADIEILPPSATEEMITSPWDLSLYTCTYSASGRITVRCKQTNM